MCISFYRFDDLLSFRFFFFNEVALKKKKTFLVGVPILLRTLKFTYYKDYMDSIKFDNRTGAPTEYFGQIFETFTVTWYVIIVPL